MNATACALIGLLVLCPGRILAQPANTDKQPEPVAILELGGAGGWDIKGGASSFGPTAAVEVTPIERWLELEAVVTPLFTRHSAEWGVDLLFKKPWTLSKKAEVMFGIGPEWVHARQGGIATNAIAGEAVVDFMFWPSGKRKLGWYVEPGYEYRFGRQHMRSVVVSMGVLIAIR